MFYVIIGLIVLTLCHATEPDTFYFETLEEQPIGTLIGRLPILSGHNYRISGNEESKRHIDLSTENGTIKVKHKIDRESLKSDQLVLALIDEDNLSVKTIKIRVNDINDNDPSFSSPFYNISLIESSVLGKRSLPTAFDPDKAENGTISSYRLQNASNTFAITNENDSAYLYLIGQLNYQRQATYELRLLAFDNGKPSRNGSITIFVNIQDSNEAPKFDIENYNITTSVKTYPNQPLLKMHATDPDSGTNGILHYQIQNDPSSQFRIDSKTGEIFVKEEVEFLDCNSLSGQNICVITVEAIDGGYPPLKTREIVRIHVSESNTHSPIISVKTHPLGFNAAFVDVNSKTDTAVAVLTIRDGDQGLAGMANLSIVSGNDKNWFRLESGNNFGIIRVIKLEPINIRRFYELIIQATDHGIPSRSTQQAVKLTVYDNSANYRYLDESSNQMYTICKGLPCYNGICDSTNGCKCSNNYDGIFCNEKIFAFKIGSFLKLKMPDNFESLSLQFHASSNNGLLLYSHSPETNLSVEILGGIIQAKMGAFIKSTQLIQRSNYTNLELRVNDNSTSLVIDSQTLDFNQSFPLDTFFIGGVPYSLFISPNFYGCITSIQIDERPLDDSYIVEEHSLMQNCPFNSPNLSCSEPNKCGNGRCVNTWEGYYCECGDGFEATNCELENETVTSVGDRFRLELSPYSRQMFVLANTQHVIHEIEERIFYYQHNSSDKYLWDSDSRIDNWPSQWIELDVRTGKENASILMIKLNDQNVILGISDGQIYYELTNANGNRLAIAYLNGTIMSDKNWHRITVELSSYQKSIRLQVDENQTDTISHLAFPQFLSPHLEYIEIGSNLFDGCFRRILLNNQLYSLRESGLDKQFFQITSKNGSFKEGCSFCSLNKDCSVEMLLSAISKREMIIFGVIIVAIIVVILLIFNLRRDFKKKKRLNNVQRISNLQLISTCESEFGHDNATYNSNADFAYLPSYIPIYSNVGYSTNEICSCHYSSHNLFPNQYYLQDGIVTKFELHDSHNYSLSSSSTDIPLDPSLNSDYRLNGYHSSNLYVS